MSGPFSVRVGQGVTRCRPTTPGQNAKSDGHRQHQEHDRHHHQDLLAGAATSISSRRPASRTSAAWACSTSASGVPRSTATAMPSANRATSGSPVARGQPRRRPPPTGVPVRIVGQHRAEVGGQLAARCGGPPGRARRPGPRRRPRPARAARRRSGTRRGSRRSRVGDLARSGGCRAAARRATNATRHSTSSGTVPPGAASATQHAVRRGRPRTRPAPTAPARPGTRARSSCRSGPLEAAAYRRGAAEHPLDAVGRASAAAARTRPARRRGRRGDATRSAGVRPTCGRSRT